MRFAGRFLHGRMTEDTRFHSAAYAAIFLTIRCTPHHIYELKEVMFITSIERHEARFQRRSTLRQAKRFRYSRQFGCFDEVFSYSNLYEAGKCCCKGVMWKSSVQSYMGMLTSNTAHTHEILSKRKFKSRGFYKFDLVERGKLRHISSVHISERIVQRCLCDNALMPIFAHSFIYDNSASQKGKGVDFAMDRLDSHLHRFYRKHGHNGLNNGYVLIADFSDFFNRAPHHIIYNEISRRLHDIDIKKLSCQFMEDFGDTGFGIGSLVSQIDALMVASPLDHFIKEKLRIKYYGRYMDDFYLICDDKEYLKYCLKEIKKKCDEYGFELNAKKTKITPLRYGVKFLKTKFILTDSGKVVRKSNSKSYARMKKKLKKFRSWVDCGKFTAEDAAVSFNSWCGYMKRGNSRQSIYKMSCLYKSLFA